MGGGSSKKKRRLVEGAPVHPRVWRTGRSNEYPEHTELSGVLDGTADVGLAFGGGGIRAACEGLGVLMALESLGLLKRVRYCSTVSGSTWLNATFAFLPEKFSVSDFIGQVIEPAGLTPEVIEEPPNGSFLQTAGDAKPIHDFFTTLVKGAFQCLCPKCSKESLRAWNQAVTTAYLKPYELQQQSGVMAPPQGTKAYARAAEALKPTSARLYPLRTGSPFPILNACKKLPLDGQASQWYALEFTPLYGGVPALNSDAPGGAIGGGVVEMFGLGSEAPTTLPDGRTAVENGEVVEVKPANFVPLGFAAGAGSAALYGEGLFPIKTADAERFLGGPVMPLWSAADIKSPNNGMALLGDAGLADMSGLIALLRRGVTRAIVSLAPHVDPGGDSFLSEVWWPCLFGKATQASFLGVDEKAEEMNRFAQVFEGADFQPLWDQLQAKTKAREPCVVDVTLKVLRNDVCGVQGGYDVRILWMLPVLSASFESQLPAATQDLLRREPKSFSCLKEQIHDNGFIFSHFLKVLDKNFPFVATSAGDYAPNLCSMLAQNTAYNLLVGAGKDNLRAFFAS